MKLTTWSPLIEMASLHHRVNRMLADPFISCNTTGEAPAMGTWNPAADIFDDGSTIFITMELPGFKKEDINIDYKDQVLTLKGERQLDSEKTEGRYFRRERVSGYFNRSFSLPGGFDPDVIKAEYKDGVLRIEIPKPEKEKPKQIAVN